MGVLARTDELVSAGVLRQLGVLTRVEELVSAGVLRQRVAKRPAWNSRASIVLR